MGNCTYYKLKSLLSIGLCQKASNSFSWGPSKTMSPFCNTGIITIITKFRTLTERPFYELHIRKTPQWGNNERTKTLLLQVPIRLSRYINNTKNHVFLRRIIDATRLFYEGRKYDVKTRFAKRLKDVSRNILPAKFVKGLHQKCPSLYRNINFVFMSINYWKASCMHSVKHGNPLQLPLFSNLIKQYRLIHKAGSGQKYPFFPLLMRNSYTKTH